MCMVCYSEIHPGDHVLPIYQVHDSNGDMHSVGAIHFECPGESA